MAYGFSFGSSGRYGRSRYNKELTPAGRVFMALMGIIFIIMPFMEFDRYSKLARDGKEAVATVISYNPTYTRNKNGTTTNHWHVLSYDGSQKRVELKRQLQPGIKISIVYDPSQNSFAAEGKKGMAGSELMGSGFQMMWLMVLLGIGVILAAFFAPSKPGPGLSTQTGTAYNPPPESFSGLADNKPAAKAVADKNFKPAIETAIPFAPGGPGKQEQPKQAPSAGFSKFGTDVMDEGYRLFKEHAEFAAAALAETFGYLTQGQAKEVISKADALDYAAEDEANNVQGGLYTADKAAANLIKTNPGFSEQLYKNVINEKMKSS